MESPHDLNVVAFLSEVLQDKWVGWRSCELCARFLLEWIRLNARVEELMRQRKMTPEFGAFMTVVRTRIDELRRHFAARDQTRVNKPFSFDESCDDARAEIERFLASH